MVSKERKQAIQEKEDINYKLYIERKKRKKLQQEVGGAGLQGVDGRGWHCCRYSRGK